MDRLTQNTGYKSEDTILSAFKSMPRDKKEELLTSLAAEQKRIIKYIESNVNASTGNWLSDVTRNVLSIGGGKTDDDKYLAHIGAPAAAAFGTGMVAKAAIGTGLAIKGGSALAAAAGPIGWGILAAAGFIVGVPHLIGEGLVFEPGALDVGDMLKGPNKTYHENVQEAASYLVEINKAAIEIAKQLENEKETDRQKKETETARTAQETEKTNATREQWEDLIQTTRQLERGGPPYVVDPLNERQSWLIEKLIDDEKALSIIRLHVPKESYPNWIDKPEVSNGKDT
jgi:hypothetical protein